MIVKIVFGRNLLDKAKVEVEGRWCILIIILFRTHQFFSLNPQKMVGVPNILIIPCLYSSWTVDFSVLSSVSSQYSVITLSGDFVLDLSSTQSRFGGFSFGIIFCLFVQSKWWAPMFTLYLPCNVLGLTKTSRLLY